MKLRKILSLIMALTVSAAALTGCGNEKKEEEKKQENVAVETEKTNEEATDVQKGEKGVLKMATNAAFPPYEYKEGEEFAGIDVEIAGAIAEKLGYELEIVDMEFDSIIASVQNGETDFGMAGMTVTDERKEEVDFSFSYATGVQVVIVPEDSPIVSLDDLNGKKIGVQLGTTGDIYATDDYGADFVTQYSKGADAIIALKGGDVDAVIIDNEPAKAFVEQNGGLKILDTEYAVEDYAIAVKKDNPLLDDINSALEELTVDETIDNIIAKYISAE